MHSYRRDSRAKRESFSTVYPECLLSMSTVRNTAMYIVYCYEYCHDDTVMNVVRNTLYEYSLTESKDELMIASIDH